MNPQEYDGREWTALARELTPRQLKAALKSSYRAVAKKAKAVAERELFSSGLNVTGDRSDIRKGIRTYVYSRGGGFLVTVNARRGASGEKSMHTNRFGRKKPVLMWAEEGTVMRRTKSNTGRHTRAWTRRLRRGHSTGRMPAYGFLAKATPEMFRVVENDLEKDLEKAVVKKAAKCGFI